MDEINTFYDALKEGHMSEAMVFLLKRQEKKHLNVREAQLLKQACLKFQAYTHDLERLSFLKNEAESYTKVRNLVSQGLELNDEQKAALAELEQRHNAMFAEQSTPDQAPSHVQPQTPQALPDEMSKEESNASEAEQRSQQFLHQMKLALQAQDLSALKDLRCFIGDFIADPAEGEFYKQQLDLVCTRLENYQQDCKRLEQAKQTVANLRQSLANRVPQGQPYAGQNNGQLYAQSGVAPQFQGQNVQQREQYESQQAQQGGFFAQPQEQFVQQQGTLPTQGYPASQVPADAGTVYTGRKTNVEGLASVDMTDAMRRQAIQHQPLQNRVLDQCQQSTERPKNAEQEQFNRTAQMLLSRIPDVLSLFKGIQGYINERHKEERASSVNSAESLNKDFTALDMVTENIYTIRGFIDKGKSTDSLIPRCKEVCELIHREKKPVNKWEADFLALQAQAKAQAQAQEQTSDPLDRLQLVKPEPQVAQKDPILSAQTEPLFPAISLSKNEAGIMDDQERAVSQVSAPAQPEVPAVPEVSAPTAVVDPLNRLEQVNAQTQTAFVQSAASQASAQACAAPETDGQSFIHQTLMVEPRPVRELSGTYNSFQREVLEGEPEENIDLTELSKIAPSTKGLHFGFPCATVEGALDTQSMSETFKDEVDRVSLYVQIPLQGASAVADVPTPPPPSSTAPVDTTSKSFELDTLSPYAKQSSVWQESAQPQTISESQKPEPAALFSAPTPRPVVTVAEGGEDPYSQQDSSGVLALQEPADPSVVRSVQQSSGASLDTPLVPLAGDVLPEQAEVVAQEGVESDPASAELSLAAEPQDQDLQNGDALSAQSQSPVEDLSQESLESEGGADESVVGEGEPAECCPEPEHVQSSVEPQESQVSQSVSESDDVGGASLAVPPQPEALPESQTAETTSETLAETLDIDDPFAALETPPVTTAVAEPQSPPSVQSQGTVLTQSNIPAFQCDLDAAQHLLALAAPEKQGQQHASTEESLFGDAVFDFELEKETSPEEPEKTEEEETDEPKRRLVKKASQGAASLAKEENKQPWDMAHSFPSEAPERELMAREEHMSSKFQKVKP